MPVVLNLCFFARCDDLFNLTHGVFLWGRLVTCCRLLIGLLLDREELSETWVGRFANRRQVTNLPHMTRTNCERFFHSFMPSRMTPCGNSKSTPGSRRRMPATIS